MIGIKYLRKSLGLTGEDIAKEIGVSKSLISKWESGKQKIADEYKEAIVLKYGGYPEFLDKELEEEETFLMDISVYSSKKKQFLGEEITDQFNQRVYRLLSYDKGKDVLNIMLTAAEYCFTHNIRSFDNEKYNSARNGMINIIELTFGKVFE